MPELIPHATAGDDPGFLELVRRAVETLVAVERPARVSLVHIDNWFDAKWLEFRGKAVGQVGTWSWPGELNLPPFHPHRVLAQQDWLLQGEDYVPASLPTLARIQTSAENHKRYSALVAPRSLLVWYSGNTGLNRKGALMLHLPAPDDPRPVFVALDADPRWHATAIKGASRNEVEELLSARAAS